MPTLLTSHPTPLPHAWSPSFCPAHPPVQLYTAEMATTTTTTATATKAANNVDVDGDNDNVPYWGTKEEQAAADRGDPVFYGSLYVFFLPASASSPLLFD